MILDPLSIFLGLLAGALPVLLIMGVLLMRAQNDKAGLIKDLEHERAGREELGNLFSLTAQEALQKNSEQFLARFGELAQEKIKQAKTETAHELEKKHMSIAELVNPIRKQLESLGGAVEQIKGTDMALREDLTKLGKETARLVGALRDPAARGRWGEFILEGLLDKSGLMKGVHYETQVSVGGSEGRQRPDAIIRLHDGFHIVVDAKAPLNRFVDKLGETMTPEEMQKLMGEIAKSVRDHVRALGRKNYWENVESPDFTVMFLPSEHLFSVALQADPGLVDYAAENDIVIASPTLMMSLLRVVGLSWRQVDLAQNAQEISARGADLYKRLSAFGTHLERIGKGIGGAMDNYNKAIGSLERSVMPAARKLKELNAQGVTSGEMPEIDMLEAMPQKLQSDDFSATSDEDAPQEPKKQA